MHTHPQVSDSDVFERNGFDVHSNVWVSFTQAILGGEVKIPGLHGSIMVKVRHGRTCCPYLATPLLPLLSRYLLVSNLITGYG